MQCPENFERKDYGGYEFCYKPGRVSYEKAKDNCHSNGLRVIEIDSENKSMALDSFANRDYAWLGLVCPSQTDKCLSNFDLWIWENSKRRLIDTSGWEKHFYKSGSTIRGGTPGKYCVHWWYKGSTKSHWVSQTCTKGYGTLCEKGMHHLRQ